MEGERLPAEVLGARLLEGTSRSAGTPVVLTSGRTGEGIPELLKMLDEVLQFDLVETVLFRIPMKDGASIAMLHARGRIRHEDYQGNVCEIEVDAPASLQQILSRYLVKTSSVDPVENSV